MHAHRPQPSGHDAPHAGFRAFPVRGPERSVLASLARAWRGGVEGAPPPSLIGAPPLCAPPPPPARRRGGGVLIRWGSVAVLHVVVGAAALLISPRSAHVVTRPPVPVMFLPATPPPPAPPVPPAKPPVAKPPPRPAAQARPARPPPATPPPAAAAPPPAPVNLPTAPLAAAGEAPPPESPPSQGGVPGGVAGGVEGGVGTRAVPAPARPASATAVRRTVAAQPARLLSGTAPAYPASARSARLEGRVMLLVVVGVDGRVTEVRVLSGNPELSRAAMEAVRQWTYQPGRDRDGRLAVSQVLTPVEFKLQS